MIQDFRFTEADARVFQTEFASRLPDRIIDGHNHCWQKESIAISREEYGIYKQYKPWTDFDFMEEFTLEDFDFCTRNLFPGKELMGTFFGLPFLQIDREKSNQYIVETATEQCRGFYYIPGQFEDAAQAENRYGLTARKGFLGLKPYPDLAQVKGREVSLYDMINHSFLEYADKHGLSIMLHIPGKERLHSETLRKELLHCVSYYSGATFIMAHVGRSFCYADVEGTIDFLTSRENVFFDTALVNDPLVIEYLLRRVPSERVLYGSDSPLAFTRGKDVCINNKHYYVSDHVVPWGLGPAKEDLIDLSFYAYEELRSILYASRAVYGSREETHLENIFWENSRRMLSARGLLL